MRTTNLLIGLLFLASTAWAQSTNQQQSGPYTTSPTAVPHLVKFSGSVKDLNGKPLTGVAGVTFYLYKDDQGGAPLWLETQNVQLDAGGHYSVMLGATQPDGLPADLFSSGEARWLGVQQEGQSEQPRVLLLSVPYALKAGDAETIGGLPPSAFMRAPEPGGAAASRAVNNGAAQASSNTAAASAITGTGTANYLPIWTGTSTLGSSPLFAKSGLVGIGTKTPATTLDVNGAATIRGNATITGTLSASTSLTAPSGGFSGNNSSQILSVKQSGTGAGLVATTAATGPVVGALSGTATSTTGRAKGVMGISFGDSGVGVYGISGSFGGSRTIQRVGST